MKIVSFNINSIRAHMPQLEEIIKIHEPDIIGLQETKVSDEDFPEETVRGLGYNVFYHGQKTHYGVAILCKSEPEHVQKGFPGDDPEAQKRMIALSFKIKNAETIRIINSYFPQGENRSHETKFPAKTRYYADMYSYITAAKKNGEIPLLMGDFNVAPEDLDIGIGDNNRKRWLREGKSAFLPEEREWYEKIISLEMSDTFRMFHEADDLYSWFDYRSRGFDRTPKRGLRIDMILASGILKDKCTSSGIDYEVRAMEKPSDHCPIWADFKI